MRDRVEKATTEDDRSEGLQVLSAGHINWDVTMHVSALPAPDGEVLIDTLVQSGGGSAANVAAGLVGLETPAAVYGSVGGDEAGAMALRELERVGVDPGHVLIDGDAETSVKYLIVDESGEVMILSNEGANEAFTAADLDGDVLGHVDHLHLTSQAPETAASLAEAAHEATLPVSFDPGRRVGERGYDATLRETDLLFVNDREAELVERGGIVSPRSPDGFVAVIKRGSEGAAVRTPAGEISHPGFAIEAVDTTGAGDAFAAGFTAALFETGVHERLDGGSLPFDPETYDRALVVGNACGALAAQEASARVDLTWDGVEKLIETQDGSDVAIGE